MVMYSNDGAYPAPALPFRVRRKSGLTYTAEAATDFLSDPDHPWFEVSDPPSYDAETHTLGWSGSDWVVAEIVEPEPEPEPEPQTLAEVIVAPSTFDIILAESAPDQIIGVATAGLIIADEAADTI